ncbi:hypothetical protein IAI10_20235 [Clostridium sp. 19966]|uniref:hypothetical protein n=1 Tax=Clostridium sp. 19966 TaxID=2768166 RepID=UPI0028E027E9|nr:hypothetical protein [Clostridium sp. 19966]MDT8718986.1 hypothetical protein [Clostridium sp. 19966]
MDIIQTIDTVLSNVLTPLNIQSFYGWYDSNINDTHVTFIQLNDNETDFADDEAESVIYYVQVDIWSHENVEDLKVTIKNAMKTIENCTYEQGQDFYEPDTKLFHKALRFYIQDVIES